MVPKNGFRHHKMGSPSTLVVVEWNSPQSYRYFDDVMIFFRILHLSENLLLCLSHSAAPPEFFLIPRDNGDIMGHYN